MTAGVDIETSVPGKAETIPPVNARIIIGGKVSQFSGVLPGLFEESLYCLEAKQPLYILGGFGGAAANLAGFITKKYDHASCTARFGCPTQRNTGTRFT